MLSKPANLYQQRKGSIHLAASAEVAEGLAYVEFVAILKQEIVMEVPRHVNIYEVKI